MYSGRCSQSQEYHVASAAYVCVREQFHLPLHFFIHTSKWLLAVGLPFMVPCERINQWKLVVIRQTYTHAEVERSERKKTGMKVSDESKAAFDFHFIDRVFVRIGKYLLFRLYASNAVILFDSMWREWESDQKRQTQEIDELMIYSWVERQRGKIDLIGKKSRTLLTNELWQLTDGILNATDKIRKYDQLEYVSNESKSKVINLTFLTLQCNPSADTYRISNDLGTVWNRLNASQSNEGNKFQIERKTATSFLFRLKWKICFDFYLRLPFHRILFPDQWIIIYHESAANRNSVAQQKPTLD